jgi:hypothetical protein
MAKQKRETLKAGKANQAAEPARPCVAGSRTATRKLSPIRRTQRQRMRLGDAFRREGLDERTVAQTWVVVVERLRNGSGGADGVEKLLVDVLKECDRILLDTARAGGPGGSDAPSVVNLYHNVPRPVREAQGAEKEAEAVSS